MREHRGAPVALYQPANSQHGNAEQYHDQQDDQQTARVPDLPAVRDVCGHVRPDPVEAPLAQAELAVEPVNQVQAERTHGHRGRLEQQASIKVI